MKAKYSVGLVAAILALAIAVLIGCGDGDQQTGATEPPAAQSATTRQDQTAQHGGTTAAQSGQDGSPVETEVTGIPGDSPQTSPSTRAQ